MPYTPAYNAVFAKPLLNQLIAIIQRDQQAAIQIVNPSLIPIEEFHKGPAMRTALPWLTLAAESTRFDALAADVRKSLTRVTLALDVGQFDQDLAQDNAQDYARVLDMVITTASISDYTAPLSIVHQSVPSGTTTPSAPGSVKEVFLEAHEYSLATLNEVQVPVLRVTLQVLLYLEET
jgi:hypothetical protein